ncbi:hypothetical protein PCASD_24989 [Puccinia coronata f. sp. avenae]|uniref:Uncharacterized protein n=1 Tax=Puccinia coronata f. sp. avenae TaxID=200324 RepID=A0A2N5TJ15_9BASI|nr:hypothetical protein PCASD_24989 [Puccinia coronata f. sp. avenae]
MSPRRNPLVMLRRRDGNRRDGQPIHHQPSAMMYRLLASQWSTQYRRRRFYIGSGDPSPVLIDTMSGLVDVTSVWLDSTLSLLDTTPAPLDVSSVVLSTTSLLPDAITAWLDASSVRPNAASDTRTDTTPYLREAVCQGSDPLRRRIPFQAAVFLNPISEFVAKNDLTFLALHSPCTTRYHHPTNLTPNHFSHQPTAICRTLSPSHVFLGIFSAPHLQIREHLNDSPHRSESALAPIHPASSDLYRHSRVALT